MQSRNAEIAVGEYPQRRGILDGVPSYFAKALLFDFDGTLIDSKKSNGVVPKGAFKLLNQLPPDAWAIVTACDRQVAETRLTSAGLPVPKVMVTADDVENGKPDPQGYLTAARKLRVRPEDAIVFEDALSGIEAARRANMRCIALRTTAASDEMLQDATEIIDDLDGVSSAIYMRGVLIHIRSITANAS